MSEPKISDKPYQLPVKQEPYDALTWANLDHESLAEMNKYPHSNSFFPGKFQSKNPLLVNDFNNIIMGNPEFHAESVPYNQNTNLNFIGDLNENSLKNNTNLLMPEKQLDISKQMPFNIPDKMQSNMSEMFPNSYGINKYLAKPYPTEFHQMAQPKAQHPFSAIPFYFPFLGGTYRRPLPPELIEEEPIYVNPRQYERIIKRRIQKASRGIKNEVTASDKAKAKPYKHLSRHLHAKRRVRGKGGRFLSKEEADKVDSQKDIGSHHDTATNSPITNKDHLASTSKSSNDGEYSQEENDVKPKMGQQNEKSTKSDANYDRIDITPKASDNVWN
jgi:hypothetical protein